MTHPGGAGPGRALCLQRKMFIPWELLDSCLLLFWLESHLASRAGQDGDPEVQSLKYLWSYAPHVQLVQRIAGSKEGGSSEKEMVGLNWAERRRRQ